MLTTQALASPTNFVIPSVAPQHLVHQKIHHVYTVTGTFTTRYTNEHQRCSYYRLWTEAQAIASLSQLSSLCCSDRRAAYCAQQSNHEQLTTTLSEPDSTTTTETYLTHVIPQHSLSHLNTFAGSTTWITTMGPCARIMMLIALQYALHVSPAPAATQPPTWAHFVQYAKTAPNIGALHIFADADVASELETITALHTHVSEYRRFYNKGHTTTAPRMDDVRWAQIQSAAISIISDMAALIPKSPTTATKERARQPQDKDAAISEPTGDFTGTTAQINYEDLRTMTQIGQGAPTNLGMILRDDSSRMGPHQNSKPNTRATFPQTPPDNRRGEHHLLSLLSWEISQAQIRSARFIDVYDAATKNKVSAKIIINSELTSVMNMAELTANKAHYRLRITRPEDILLCRTTFITTNKGFSVIIHVPVAPFSDMGTFTILRFIPTPILTSTGDVLFVRPTKEFLALNEDTGHFKVMSSDDITDCDRMDGLLICPATTVVNKRISEQDQKHITQQDLCIYYLHEMHERRASKACPMTISPAQEGMYPIGDNKVIFTTMDSHRSDITCANKEDRKHFAVSTVSDPITIEPGCQATTKTHIFYAGAFPETRRPRTTSYPLKRNQMDELASLYNINMDDIKGKLRQFHGLQMSIDSIAQSISDDRKYEKAHGQHWTYTVAALGIMLILILGSHAALQIMYVMRGLETEPSVRFVRTTILDDSTAPPPTASPMDETHPPGYSEATAGVGDQLILDQLYSYCQTEQERIERLPTQERHEQRSMLKSKLRSIMHPSPATSATPTDPRITDILTKTIRSIDTSQAATQRYMAHTTPEPTAPRGYFVQ